jgi:hypothetical protein
MAVGQIASDRTMGGHTIRYRPIARQLRDSGLSGPMASTNYWNGLYIAYHYGRTYLGTTATGDLTECEAALDEHGVNVFLVWSKSPLHAVFASSPSWERIITGEHPDTRFDQTLDVYVRRKTDGGV